VSIRVYPWLEKIPSRGKFASAAGATSCRNTNHQPPPAFGILSHPMGEEQTRLRTARHGDVFWQTVWT
jgi:hypothetical protein